MVLRLVAACLLYLPLCAQQPEQRIDSTSEWVCISYPNDPLQTKYYSFKNGFSLIVSPDKSTPDFYAAVAVRAGGKDDPANNTGLAHYLEHMLFKGTDKMGTIDYQKEVVYLNKIESLYEKYNGLTDPEKRKKVYQAIDSVSLLASNFAIANEYDKLMQQMGVTKTNAFTEYDQTVYINQIPSVQLQNWMQVEFERFRNPVLRLFHTELEAVFEEKNISLDADDNKAFEALMQRLFKKHPYGTQTIIGRSEHLKNPSMKEIRKYYQTHYIPGNMALIIAGNVEPDEVAGLALKSFGTLPAKEVVKKTPPKEDILINPQETKVYGQESQSVLIGFRLPSVYKTGLAERFYLLEQLLGNEQIGLIQQNLLLPQKVLSASAGIYRLSDYSVLFLEGKPLEGQSLEQVKELLLAQIDSLKKNKPDQDMLQAISSNLALKRMEAAEVNESRVFRLLDPFIHGEEPTAALNEKEKMDQVKPMEISILARQYLDKNYVVVLKEQGRDTSVQKMDKPPISTVTLNRDHVSKFAKDILDNEVKTQEPKWVDLKKDIKTETLNAGITLNHVRNKDNKRFKLDFVYETGSLNDQILPLAFRYLQLAGSKKYDMNYINRELYRLACAIDISVGEYQTRISLSGDSEHFERALALLCYFVDNPSDNQEILNTLVSTIIRERDDRLTDRATIRVGMVNYALYGPKNPFNQVLSNKQLKSLKLDELTMKSKFIRQYQHQVYYYGPEPSLNISKLLNKYHEVKQPFINIQAKQKFTPIASEKRKLLFYPYEMVQADIGWLGAANNGFNYDSSATYALFNEYFGGSMASIVFQTIREARALAYSCNGYFSVPWHVNKPSYFSAYIGTQADKADSAIVAMNELLHKMPILPAQLQTAKKAKESQLSNAWIKPSGLLDFYRNQQNKGLLNDQRKEEFVRLNTLTINDIDKFHQNKLSHERFAMYVVADPAILKKEVLRKYGKVKQLNRKDLFGY